MLEVGKRYSKIELNAIFGECSVQSMIRKLNRYQVDVQVFGRGEKAQFKILEIGDPFKLFCITELDFDANTDFDKLQYFYYYFFNDDEFAAMPDEEKARQMNDRGCPVGRQTIANYIRKLEQNVWIAKDTENCIYYFARKFILWSAQCKLFSSFKHNGIYRCQNVSTIQIIIFGFALKTNDIMPY